MSAENEAALSALRRESEASQRRYLQVLGEIKAKKATLDEAMGTLAEMGCGSIAEAERRIADLQVDIEERLTEIRRLLG